VLPGGRWRSGFVIAPQIGWKGMLASYGLSQFQYSSTTLLASKRSLTPGLAVPVTRESEGGAGALYCEPPRSRLDTLRTATGTAAGILFAFRPF
jgi:hypothetical protein